MKEHYDVVIVGAGPAGLMAAKVLAEGGKDVVVFEKNKVIGDKVCAGGITEKDMKYSIPESIIERKFNKIVVSTERQRIEMQQATPIVMTVNRRRLGEWQCEQTKKAGAQVFLETTVSEITAESVTAAGLRVNYDYLIGADGAASIVRKFVGLVTDEMLVAFQYIIKEEFKDLELHVNPTRFGLTYLWIFPYKGTASIGTGIDVGRTRTIKDLRHNFEKWLEERNIDYHNALFESAPINYDYEGHDFGNIFLAGDAGGFTSPLTAEGIYSSFVSGEEIAKKNNR